MLEAIRNSSWNEAEIFVRADGPSSRRTAPATRRAILTSQRYLPNQNWKDHQACRFGDMSNGSTPTKGTVSSSSRTGPVTLSSMRLRLQASASLPCNRARRWSCG
jgi:hypothetical protein